MQLNYCQNCFEPIQANGKCPVCGFDLAGYTAPSHHLPPETILHGRYLVGKALGEGGFGITYIGLDLVLERKVAVKEFFPEGNVWRDRTSGLSVSCYSSKQFTETFESGKQRCMKEAKALAKLDDIDSVVRILDHFLENNTAYVIMEYVRGMTLKDVLKSRTERMTFPQVRDLLLPIMHSVGIMHQRGFIHRDISPDNIMVTQFNTAKLLDFGAVKSITRNGSSTNHPIFKRGFSPLEQYSSEGQLGPWSDIYSFCATMFYMLTGSILSDPTERLQSDNAQIRQKLKGVVPARILPVLEKGLSVYPRDRQQTMDEFIGQLTASSRKGSGRGESKRISWISGVIAVLLFLLLVVLIVVVIIHGVRGGSPPETTALAEPFAKIFPSAFIR